MIEASIAAVLVALLGHDAFRRWLTSVNSDRISKRELIEHKQHVTTQLALTETKLAERDETIKKLAVDWKAKFVELEAAVKTTKEHVDTQLVGSLAQMPSRGFGR